MRLSAFVLLLLSLPASAPAWAESSDTWRGLVIAPEHRCSRYVRSDYPYAPSVECEIVERQLGGSIASPYTQQCHPTHKGPNGTDIEHIIALSEAHDSGLCGAGTAVKEAFASDLLNLTLASPKVNRRQKRDKDAAEWMPEYNRCWFADRVLQIRSKYKLTIDRREASALEGVLTQCANVDLRLPDCDIRPLVCSDYQPRRRPAKKALSSEQRAALERWDDNDNGGISCKEARNHGLRLPVVRGHVAYALMRDGDGDGQVCE